MLRLFVAIEFAGAQFRLFSVASCETDVPSSTAPIGRGRICFKEIVAASTSLGNLSIFAVFVAAPL